MTNCKSCGQVLPKKPVPKTLTQFFELISNEFETNDNIDILFSDFGKNWFLGTIGNYVKTKQINLTGYYIFIAWLKRGFHLKEKGSYDVINTTVESKLEYYSTFIDRALEYISTNEIIESETTNQIYELLKDCEDTIFELTPEKKFLQIFQLAYHTWDKNKVIEKGIPPLQETKE